MNLYERVCKRLRRAIRENLKALLENVAWPEHILEAYLLFWREWGFEG